MVTTVGTYNVDHLLAQHAQSLLLPDGRIEKMMGLGESECSRFLGEPYHDWENEKGYTKEWYYTTHRGELLGLSFRWGDPRLRGNATTTTTDVIEFVDFLHQTVRKRPSK